MRGRGQDRRWKVEGRIQHKGTFAFLLAEKKGDPDVYLGGPSVRLAMDGDRVEALVERRGDRLFGELTRVVSRARTTAVGVLRKVGKFWGVFPPDVPEDQGYEVLEFARGVEPAPGQLVTLRIDRWPTETRGPGGTVTELLGGADEPAARRKAVLAARDISTEFSSEALAEAEALPLDPAEADWAGRKVLFDLPIFTIDGADAKDFDDAVSLESVPGGKWKLGVHIASVADYVKPGTALDDDAGSRATSVYLPGRVIPMLPPKLSDHLCSLRPDVPRLTMTCWLHLDADGLPGRVDLQETVIRSWRRFTYEEIQDVLDGKDVERVVPEVKTAVLAMGALAKKITKARMDRGALDMAAPEYGIKCDPDGNPIASYKRPRLDSHRLIEEFMVAANEAVARTLSKARAPFLRRVHEDPDPDRLAELEKEMGKLGIKAPIALVANPVKGLQGLLKAAQGHPFEETANIQVIRSMKQARYSPDQAGHFGLASTDYCHFTSPIRRYPDLQVHRAVKAVLRGRPQEHAEGMDLDALGQHCSEKERLAAEAERKAVDLARASLMGREIGNVFDGVIVNIIPSGVFVSLPANGASGFWRGGTGTLGQKLVVKLTGADELLGRLEFEPVREATMPQQARVTPWRNPGKPGKPGKPPRRR